MMDDGTTLLLDCFLHTLVFLAGWMDGWVGGMDRVGLASLTALRGRCFGWVGWVAKFDIRGIAFGTSFHLFSSSSPEFFPSSPLLFLWDERFSCRAGGRASDMRACMRIYIHSEL